MLHFPIARHISQASICHLHLYVWQSIANLRA
jgi:hypothetical protein